MAGVQSVTRLNSCSSAEVSLANMPTASAELTKDSMAGVQSVTRLNSCSSAEVSLANMPTASAELTKDSMAGVHDITDLNCISSLSVNLASRLIALYSAQSDLSAAVHPMQPKKAARWLLVIFANAPKRSTDTARAVIAGVHAATSLKQDNSSSVSLAMSACMISLRAQ